MTEISRPWNGTSVGDAGPYSDAHWHQLYRAIIGYGAGRANNGVFLSSGTQPNDGLRVTAQSPVSASVNVNPGAALIQGIAYMNDAVQALAITPNVSGNPRIDMIVVQVDYALQTARLAVRLGAPAASPSRPSLIQWANIMWEIPIAYIAVANGFVTIAQTAITQAQEWVNAPPGVFLDSVLNNSGVALEDGDVVAWDNTASRAVTTTTTADDKQAAGIWRGNTPNGSYGRVQVRGIGYVRANAAVAIGRLLTSSTTIRQAAPSVGVQNKVLARAIETTSGSGLVLANIDVRSVTGYDSILIRDEKASGGAPASIVLGAWRVRELNTEVYDTGGFASLPGSNRIRLEAGKYEFWANAPLGATTAANAIRLFNFSDTAVVAEGSHGGATSAMLAGTFTITAQKDFELQQWTSATIAGGGALSTGSNEIYASIYLRRTGDTP